MSIKDGRVVDVVPTIDPHADVAISCGFGDLMRIRKQEITLLDTDAKIAGSQGALALFAGVAEHSLYRRAQLGCVTGTACDALATLGELAVRTDYRAAIDAILDTSVPDRG
jgi:hypothetical protein